MQRILYIAFGCLVLLTSQSVRAGDIADQERKNKIEKIDSWFSNVTQDPSEKFRESAGAIAMQSTLQLGAGSKDWGPTNPNWKHVYDQVNKDIQGEINQLFAEQGNDVGSIFKTRFADALSNEDVDALTEFSRSNKGQRYWKLSNEIAKMITETALHMNDFASIKPKSQPTDEELKSWERFTAVSISTQIILGLIEKDKLAGRDTSGSTAIWMIFGMAMVLHQDDFRNIASAYENDLADFTAFIESPVGKHFVQAQIVTANDLQPKINEITLDLMNHVNTHQDSWKTMYVLTVKGISEPVQQQTITKNDLRAVRTYRDCPDCPEMVVISSGSFEMGEASTNNMVATSYGNLVKSEASTKHTVTFLKPFAIGKTEVTQGQWEAIMGNNPSHFIDNRISDCQRYDT